MSVYVWASVSVAHASETKELSHVERFAPAKIRYQDTVRKTTARLRANAKDAHALLDRGMARLHLGEFAAALEDFRRATALDPHSAESQADLAYGLWVAGKLDEALATDRKALALDPNLASAQYYAGRLLLLMGGDMQKAIVHLERAAALNPAQASMHFDLLTAYRAAGDAIRARVELRLLRASLPPTSGLLLYAEGLIAMDQGRHDKALDNFRKAVAAEPHLASARQDLGVALAQAGQWKEATEALAPLAQQSPESYSVLYFDALALQNSGQSAAAESAIRRALSLHPKSADAYTLLGVILGARGAYKEAASALEEAARLDPHSFDAQFNLGRDRYGLGDYAGAQQALQAAVTLQPTDGPARFYLATVLEEMGDHDGALAQYHELIQLRPADPRGYVGLGNFLAERGHRAEAMAQLEKALKLDPQNFEATLTVGKILVQQEEWNHAIAFLRRAVGESPQSADAHYQLGLALQRSGQTDEAKKEFAFVDRLNRQYREDSGGMGSPRQKARSPQ